MYLIIHKKVHDFESNHHACVSQSPYQNPPSDLLMRIILWLLGTELKLLYQVFFELQFICLISGTNKMCDFRKHAFSHNLPSIYVFRTIIYIQKSLKFVHRRFVKKCGKCSSKPSAWLPRRVSMVMGSGSGRLLWRRDTKIFQVV